VEPEREAVLEQLRKRIVGFAASRVSRDLAEDLAQEVLLLLSQKYPHLDRLEDLVPLSLRIVRFKLVSHWRKSQRRGENRSVSTDDWDAADARPDPLAQAEQRQFAQRLGLLLRRLEGRCREVFRLKLEGRSFAEIQARLGAHSINTVYTWDLRCRQRLLELMGGSWAQP
jgi:RNA polymerase sigma-70 factor (ECF subfamily)